MKPALPRLTKPAVRSILVSLVLFVGLGGVVSAQRTRSRQPARTAGLDWMTYISTDRTFKLDFPSLVTERQGPFSRDLPYLVGNMVSASRDDGRYFEISYVETLGAF